MPAVVSDTSPLIYLTRIGRLDWLRVIYGDVVIPGEVWRELSEGGRGFPEFAAVQTALADGWMQVHLINNEPALLLGSDLDAGEVEAIQLACKLSATLVIDESAGRAVAQKLGLKITGTAGVLLRARLAGLTDNLAGELNRLQRETTFWLADEIRDDLLRLAGETP